MSQRGSLVLITVERRWSCKCQWHTHGFHAGGVCEQWSFWACAPLSFCLGLCSPFFLKRAWLRESPSCPSVCLLSLFFMCFVWGSLLSVCRSAREPKTWQLPKVVPILLSQCSQKLGCSQELSWECSQRCSSWESTLKRRVGSEAKPSFFLEGCS